MFRQIISLITLAALMINTIGLTGCTSTTKFPIEEVKNSPPKKVTRLKFDNEEQLVWDSEGATYRREAKQFVGVTTLGDVKRVPADAVDSVLYVIGDSPQVFSQDIGTYTIAESKRSPRNLAGKVKGVLKGQEEIRFVGRRGRINWLDQTVAGRAVTGESLVMPFAEVDQVIIKQPAPGKTALLVIGLTALAGIVVLGIAASQTDFGWGSSRY
ncbi:MAG: hypothetical protein JSU74_13430 [Candidatus Zixiibacteriota bacterium]|nr:MAG: hypothetical protein JSU74_13430 [candidate division Zixibacteria bacterium]